jgi:hypothetical protein
MEGAHRVSQASSRTLAQVKCAHVDTDG